MQIDQLKKDITQAVHEYVHCCAKEAKLIQDGEYGETLAFVSQTADRAIKRYFDLSKKMEALRKELYPDGKPAK